MSMSGGQGLGEERVGRSCSWAQECPLVEGGCAGTGGGGGTTVNVLNGPERLMSCRVSVTLVNVFNLRTLS